MHSRIENFNRAIKTACPNRIIFTNQYQLRFAVKEYWEYWNHYVFAGKMNFLHLL